MRFGSIRTSAAVAGALLLVGGAAEAASVTKTYTFQTNEAVTGVSPYALQTPLAGSVSPISGNNGGVCTPNDSSLSGQTNCTEQTGLTYGSSAATLAANSWDGGTTIAGWWVSNGIIYIPTPTTSTSGNYSLTLTLIANGGEERGDIFSIAVSNGNTPVTAPGTSNSLTTPLVNSGTLGCTSSSHCTDTTVVTAGTVAVTIENLAEMFVGGVDDLPEDLDDNTTGIADSGGNLSGGNNYPAYTTFTLAADFTDIPEPVGMTALLAGLFGLGAVRYRKMRATSTI